MVAKGGRHAGQRMRWLLLVAAVAAAYAITGSLGLAFAVPPGYATALWIPSGLALAAVLRWGDRAWPGIWLGSAIVNVLVAPASGPLMYATAAVIATGSSIQALAGAGIFRGLARGEPPFGAFRGVLAFATTAIAAPLIAASVGTGAVALTGGLNFAQVPLHWATWYVGDVAGILLAAPPLLVWLDRPSPRWTGRQWLEGALLLAVGLGLALAAAATGAPLLYLAIPLVVGAVFRLGVHGSTTLVFALAIAAAVRAVNAPIPFPALSLPLALLAMQTFLGIVSLTALLVAALAAESETRRQQLLDRTRQNLEFTTTQLRQAQALARLGSWQWHVPSNRITLSPELRGMFGLPTATMEIDLDQALESIHPDDRKRLRRQVREALLAADGEPRPHDTEFRARSPDGAVRWIHARGTVTTRENGNPVRVVGVVQDITERRLAQESLARHAAELERSSVDLRQFAFVVSHDLQEPLRAVEQCTDLLEAQYGQTLGDEGRTLARFAAEETRYMRQLVEDLLAYARADLPSAPPGPVESLDAFNRAADTLQATIAETHAEIVRGPLPAVVADPTQLQQVFLNLLANAIKFRRPDTPPWIRVGAELRDNAWTFSVEDNGIGIEPQKQARLFRVFQRLHPRDSLPGTGIGLALCKKIVERHGGRIWLVSAPGSGTAVHFTLPRGPAAHAAADPAEAGASAAAASETGRF